ncbi:MAG: diguanylate cyclase domain-containing protein [Huintestinicola sp.]
MRSIQTKIILLILTGIVVSAAIIGGAGIAASKIAIDSDSEKIMNLLCSEKAQELNSTLGRIEQSVDIMCEYASTNIESMEKMVSDDEYRNEYKKVLESLGATAAAKTDGAVAYYLCFTPERFPNNEGFFKVKDPETGVFEANELTDYSKYSPDDIEHVGWYYIPVGLGRAVWLEPYYNKNIDVYMISYVEPIYYNGEIIGIVGMDIDFRYLERFINSITVYNTGYAFLTDNELDVICQKEGSSVSSVTELSASLASDDISVITAMDNLYDYTLNGVESRIALRLLNNGMCLAVTAPVSEIDAGKVRLVHQIIFMTVAIAMIFILISSAIAKTIIRPLKELNAAAKKIAEGNLTVSLTPKSRDEVGMLTTSLRETADRLKEQMEYINSLAYADSLTGINNNTAYLRDIASINCEIDNGTADFSAAVIDVNGLKQINDSHGHDKGNELLISTAGLLSDVFGRDRVYRIGGDEFAVILKNTSNEECRSLADKFTAALKEYKGAVSPSAAVGTSTFDPETDKSYTAVFRRADEEMYNNKVRMKKKGESSKVN